MWPLMIRHLGNSWPPNLVNRNIKHDASRGAVTAITARKQKGRQGRRRLLTIRSAPSTLTHRLPSLWLIYTIN